MTTSSPLLNASPSGVPQHWSQRPGHPWAVYWWKKSLSELSFFLLLLSPHDLFVKFLNLVVSWLFWQSVLMNVFLKFLGVCIFFSASGRCGKTFFFLGAREPLKMSLRIYHTTALQWELQSPTAEKNNFLSFKVQLKMNFNYFTKIIWER